jgi:hypothetical protein
VFHMPALPVLLARMAAMNDAINHSAKSAAQVPEFPGPGGRNFPHKAGLLRQRRRVSIGS